jgi:hypothetical protein
VLRGWYYLAGVTIGVAAIAAFGYDAYLRREGKRYPVWLTYCLVAAIAVWAAIQIALLRKAIPIGWASALLPLVTLPLLWAALMLYRDASGRARYALAVAVVIAAGADYKASGTSLRMNAARGDLDRFNRSNGLFPGMNDLNYAELRRSPEYRVVADQDNLSLGLRHYGLTTPQGMDPLMPRQYRRYIGNHPGESEQEIDAIAQKDLLQTLAVRYVISTESGPRYKQLMADPDFRPLASDGAYFKVFEFMKAQPPYRLAGSAIKRVAWEPEKREFQLSAKDAGQFVLIEQAYPGWEAWVDGRKVPIQLWGGSFQRIAVEPGEHRVLFRFHSRLLWPGAAVTVIWLAALTVWYRRTRAI